FVIGSIFPVATTDRVMVPTSTVARRESSGDAAAPFREVRPHRPAMPIAPRTAPSVSFLDRFMNSSGVGWTCREAIDPTRETTEDRQRRFQAVPPHEAVPAGSGGTSGGRGRQAMIVRRNARPRPGPGPAPLSMW